MKFWYFAERYYSVSHFSVLAQSNWKCDSGSPGDLCRRKCRGIFQQPQYFGAVALFVYVLALCRRSLFVRMPNLKTVISIALYLRPSHFCSFIWHNDFLFINLFCQKIFHSFACVSPAKGTSLEFLVLTWNHEPK